MSDTEQMLKLVQWQNSPDGIAALKNFVAVDQYLKKLFAEAIEAHWNKLSAAADSAAGETVAPEQILAYFMAAFVFGMRDTVKQQIVGCCEHHTQKAIAEAVNLGGNLAMDAMKFMARAKALDAAVSEKGTRH